MRRLMLVTVMAVSTAALGACDPKTEAPNKPTATPAPVSTASPAVSPAVSPAKPGETPKTGDVKKDETSTDGKNVNGNVKPAETPKAK